MNKFFLKKNINYYSMQTIEESLKSLYNLKDSKNNIISKKYLNRNIRRKNLIGVNLLMYTNEINTFLLNGIIVKKNKKTSLNSSTTVSSILSGKQVNINFHLFSNANRIV